MIRRFAAVAVGLTVLLGMPVSAQQQERTMPTRAFERFELDSNIGNGFWAEAGGRMERKDTNAPAGASGDRRTDRTIGFARFAYDGNDKWEAGLLVPVIRDTTDEFRNGEKQAQTLSENGIGDVQVAAKFVPLRGELIDLGAGAALSLPLGDHDRGLGAGEFGGMPFITGALHLAVVDVRAHVGAEFFTGSSHNGLAADRLVYGFGIFLPLGQYVALRNEFAAESFYDVSGSPKRATYFPGVDIRVPIGGLDLLLRPTGSFHVAGDTADWGFGGSIAITSPTMRAPVSSQAGGIVVE